MSVGCFAFEPLSSHHDRSSFTCGEEPLDHYFRRVARQDLKRYAAAVYVLVDRSLGCVAGFYSLSATSVLLATLPTAVQKQLPRYPDVPAALLGRLAVDNAYQGQGCGGLLLVDALKRAYLVSSDVSTAAVFVDAKRDEARSFYEHYGFQRFADAPSRLWLSMKTIAQLYR